MTEIEYNNPCTEYVDEDYGGDWVPCKCPICGGFLPGDIFQDPLICKKCGTELLAIEHNEKFKESDDYDFTEGKICVVSKGQNHKGKQQHRVNRQVKEGWKAWKAFL